MATITATSVAKLTAGVANETVLDGTDTFTFKPSGTQVLILANDTGGALSPVITGADATTENCDGVGTIDLSTGTDAFGSIASGETKQLRLQSVSKYLQGTISVTGGTGLVATLLEL